MYTCNVVYGSTGQRTMRFGFDLTNLSPSFALGEQPVIDKEIVHEKGMQSTVGKLLINEKYIRYDLILRMMLKDGVVDFSTEVKAGYNGRLREIYLVKEKESYRIFGKTYYGKVS